MKLDNKKQLNDNLKLMVKSSLFIFIGIILSKIIVYVYRIVIARSYGPDTYGLFALALIAFGFAGVLSRFGFGEGLSRFIPYYRGKKKNSIIIYLFRRTIFLSLISSLFFTLILFLTSDFIAYKIFANPALSIYLKIFSLLLPISSISNLFISTIKAYENIKWFSFINNIFDNLVKLIILAIFIYLGLNSNAVPISYTVSGLLTLILSYFVCRSIIPNAFAKKFNPELVPNRKKLMSEFYDYSTPFILFGIVGSIFYWIDSLMLGMFRGTAEVGFYNAAVPIALMLTMTKDIFSYLFFPIVTKEYSKSNLTIVKQISQQIGKWIFIINAPIFILFITFPGVFINLLFGKEYLVAENALRLLSIGAFSTAIFENSRELISMVGKSKLILYDILITTIINATLNYFLIPIYNLDGAAFSTMISLVTLNLIYVYQSKKLVSIIPIKKDAIKISLISLIPLLILILVKPMVNNYLSIALAGVFFFLIYAILILVAGCLDENDKMIYHIIKNKLLKYVK